MYTQFKPFPNLDFLNNFQKIYDSPREEIIKIEEEWKKIAQENRDINMENQRAYENVKKEIDVFLTSKGMKLYEYTIRSGSKMLPWYKTLLSKLPSPPSNFQFVNVPTVVPSSKPVKINGFEISINRYISLSEAHEYIHTRIEREYKANERRNLLIAESYKFINENKIPFSGTPDNAIGIANKIAGEKWMKEEHPEGSLLNISDNICECEVYLIGEKKCSCGNRRISVNIEGDIVHGFYLNTEAF